MWKDLSLRDKAAFMKVAINNGIYDLKDIQEHYNKFAEGGSTKWTVLDETNYLSWKDKLPDNLKYTNENEYDLRGAYKAGMEPQWNNKDKSYHLGSRDPYSGRILKSLHHPTYLEALITDASMGYYPSIDNKGNTYTNTWRGNKFGEGGPKKNKALSTGNSYVDAVLGFVPFVGSAMEIEDAVREPSLRNIGSAAFSVGTDLLGLSLLRGGIKTYRLAKAAEKARKEFNAINSSREVSRANRILETPNLNPKKYEAAGETLHNSGAHKAFEEAIKADNARISYGLYEHPLINEGLNIAGFVGGTILDAAQFINLMQL